MNSSKQPDVHLPFQAKALLFDLDDTLHDRDKAFRSWARVFINDQQLVTTDGPTEQELIAQLVALDAHGYNPRQQFFAQVSQSFPTLETPGEQLLNSYYQQIHQHLQLEEETKILLQALQEAAIPFGIITNGKTSTQKQKIETLGLHLQTSCIFISEHFGAKKPASSIFLAAADKLGVQPEEIIFIGDNPTCDMLGAYNVGMKTIWIQLERDWPEDLSPSVAHMTIHTLGELLPIFGITIQITPEISNLN